MGVSVANKIHGSGDIEYGEMNLGRESQDILEETKSVEEQITSSEKDPIKEISQQTSREFDHHLPVLGRVSHLWFGFGKFPLKIPNFSVFFPLSQKKSLRVGSKAGRPLIYCRSKVCLGWVRVYHVYILIHSSQQQKGVSFSNNKICTFIKLPKIGLFQ